MPDSRKPLIYGAFPVCRNYTVRAHIRHVGSAKRRGRENRQQHAGPLRCGLHSPHLHPRYEAKAGRGRADHGQLYGAGHVSRSKRDERTEYPSAHLLPFPRISACGSRCGSKRFQRIKKRRQNIFLKGKSNLMIFDRYADLKYKYRPRNFGCRRYYVDTVGRNKNHSGVYPKPTGGGLCR